MKISSSQYGLGDTILLTIVTRYKSGLTIQLPPDKARFACLFDRMADVEITDSCENILPDIGVPAHYGLMKLRNFFGDVADSMDIRPLVLYSALESEQWAADYLKDKLNPVIFVPTCSPQWANVRNLPDSLAKSVYQELLDKNFTPIVCQSSANYNNIGEYQLRDLSLPRYICLLRQAGRYVGCNTADEHLAVAVGCETTCLQPENHSLFQGWQWNYLNYANHNYFTWPAS